VSPEQRKHLAVFVSGGVTAARAEACAAALAYLRNGDFEPAAIAVSEQALSQLADEATIYETHPTEHKTDHDEIATALRALLAELSAQRTKEGKSHA
jgi:hypothetical protein